MLSTLALTLALAGCAPQPERVADLAVARLGDTADFGGMTFEITYLKQSVGTDYVRTTLDAGSETGQALADLIMQVEAAPEEDIPALSPELAADGSLRLLGAGSQPILCFYWIASPAWLVLVDETQGETGLRRQYRFYTLPDGLTRQLDSLRPAPSPADTPAPGDTADVGAATEP